MGRNRKGKLRYAVRCYVCGRSQQRDGYRIVRGYTCTCVQGDTLDTMIGRQVGVWRVVEFSHTNAHRSLVFWCECQCGVRRQIIGSTLRRTPGRLAQTCRHAPQVLLARNLEQVWELTLQGKGERTIALSLGVSYKALQYFLAQHTEIAALRASLSPQEELVGS